MFVYAKDNGLKTITYRDFTPAMHRAGKYVSEVCRVPVCAPTSPVVAILATAGIYVISNSTELV
jgi:hypothetical protein